MIRKLVIPVLIVAILGTLAGVYFLITQRNITNTNLDKLHVAESLLESEDYDNAIKTLLPVARYGKRFERADQVLFMLAQAYEKAGHSEAQELWKRVFEEFPQSRYAREAKYRYALTLKESNPTQMKALFEELSRQGRDRISGKCLLRLAQMHEQENQIEKTREIYYDIIQSVTDFSVYAQAKDELSRINTAILWSPALGEFSQLYTVKRGDAAVKIGQKFKTTAWFIQEANRVKANRLRPGQRLKVPKEPFHIIVYKDVCRLDLLSESGKFIKWYPVGVGEQSYKTPANEYVIINKEIDPTWYRPGGGVIQSKDPENALGTRWMGIGSSLGIHGTNKPKTIGFHKSAGCIRMYNSDVEELYKTVTYGTRVTIVEKLELDKQHEPKNSTPGASQG